jgi:transposase
MNTDKRLWRNRKAKKELARRLQSENPGLEVVHPHAAGIESAYRLPITIRSHGRVMRSIAHIECLTADLYRLTDWLQDCGVKTVVLQSTGVYWIPLYNIL